MVPLTTATATSMWSWCENHARSFTGELSAFQGTAVVRHPRPRFMVTPVRVGVRQPRQELRLPPSLGGGTPSRPGPGSLAGGQWWQGHLTLEQHRATGPESGDRACWSDTPVSTQVYRYSPQGAFDSPNLLPGKILGSRFLLFKQRELQSLSRWQGGCAEATPQMLPLHERYCCGFSRPRS